MGVITPRKLWPPKEGPPGADAGKLRSWWLWYGATAFGNARDALAGQFIPLYAVILWNNPVSVAILSSMTGVASLFQFFIAGFTERFHRSRFFVLSGNLVVSLLYIPLGLFPNIAVASVFRFGQGIAISTASPNDTALLADHTPPKDRPSRNATFLWASRLGLFVGTVGGGFLLTLLISLFAQEGTAYLALFVVSGIAGLLGILAFALSGVHDVIRPPDPEDAIIQNGFRAARDPLRARLRAIVLRNSSFLRFCLLSFVFNCTVQICSPYFVVFQTTAYQMNPAEISILTAISIAVQIVVYISLGRHAARIGLRNVMTIGGVLAGLFVVYFWYFGMNPQFRALSAFWLLFPAWILSGVGWGLFHTAEVTLLVDLAHPKHRPTSIALYNTLLALAVAIMPAVGAVFIGLLGYPSIFLLSGATRMFSALMLLAIKEPVIEGRLVYPLRTVAVRAFRHSVERGIVPFFYIPPRRKLRPPI